MQNYPKVEIMLAVLFREILENYARNDGYKLCENYRLVQLLRIFRALQTSRVHP